MITTISYVFSLVMSWGFCFVLGLVVGATYSKRQKKRLGVGWREIIEEQREVKEK
jgi:hypothetical protein